MRGAKLLLSLYMPTCMAWTAKYLPLPGLGLNSVLSGESPVTNDSSGGKTLSTFYM
jgi:hypothetical protein